MPTPRPDESHADYMARCAAAGHGPQECQAYWEETHPPPGDTGEVLLYDVIGGDPFFGAGITSRAFRERVRAVKGKVLNLRINSPGGDVFEAAAMMAALDEFEGTVEVDIDGLAASAASVVAMAGAKVRIGQQAMMMIHNPHALVVGEAGDMRSMADTLDKVKETILDAYRRRSSAVRKELSKWMDAETWLTAQEAVAAGLADSVTKGRAAPPPQNMAKIAARLGFKHTPPAVLTPPRDAAAWAATETRRKIAARL